jgi:hypothetical protein
MADVDGDGYLDLFIGGRVIAGRYPSAADSLILRNDGGRLVVNQRLEKVGLVSGAVWSDLDLDGTVELVLACEWGPVRVYKNKRGQFQEITQELGLAPYLGWWNGVAVGDLNGDGQLDVVASNWGLNTKYRANRTHPRRLYYGDLNGQGRIDLVEAYFDPELAAEVPERDFRAASAAFPWIKEKFTTFAAYGGASMANIYGPRLERAAVLEANTLESMLFLNRGGRFEAKPLPAEAQFAPAFAVCVGDYDGDGFEDVFLSQNFFAVNPGGSRWDGGRGLWLKGDGNGGLRAVPGQESGIKVYGEQRGAALSDYDQDGRIDLVVSQNGAATKLYQNVRGQPGLRVRLRGPDGNPRGIGAVMRLVFGHGQYGPARETHAGSGYWSQDSAVQVLSVPKIPTGIEIRWPGGKATTNAVTPGAKEILIEAPTAR